MLAGVRVSPWLPVLLILALGAYLLPGGGRVTLRPPAQAQPRELGGEVFRPSESDLRVRLRLMPDAAWVAEYYPVEEVEPSADGGCEVALRVADPAWLVALVLRLAGQAVVLEPAELAQRVRDEARRAVEEYRSA